MASQLAASAGRARALPPAAPRRVARVVLRPVPGRRPAPSFGRLGRGGPGRADAFHRLAVQPEIVAENVEIFKKLYDENVNYELVPGEYHAVAETKLIGGQHIDMMYSEEDRLVRWNTAGWYAITRRPAGHRGDQGQDVRDQRPQHVAGQTAAWAACPTIPASIPSSATRSIWMPPSSSRRPPGRNSSTSAAS